MTPPSNRIDRLFERTRGEKRAALVLYLTAGFPDADTTRRLLPVLERAGCDLVELGIPFSDPIADGPTIQKASTVALENGMTLGKALDLLSAFRAGSEMPVVPFGAYNPFYRRGLDRFASEAAEAGADGVLIADLPLEEARDARATFARHDLHLISLIAPTSPDSRVQRIAAASSGFLYAIAIKGITGVRGDVGESVVPYLQRLRRQTDLPLALGFGISKPEHVAQVAPHCDAVVVGSGLISLIERCAAEGLDLEGEVERYVRSLSAALGGSVPA